MDIVVQQAAVIGQLNIKLKSIVENLEAADKRENSTWTCLVYEFLFSISHERESDLIIAV